MALGPAESGKDWAMGTDYTSPLVTADVESVSTKDGKDIFKKQDLPKVRSPTAFFTALAIGSIVSALGFSTLQEKVFNIEGFTYGGWMTFITYVTYSICGTAETVITRGWARQGALKDYATISILAMGGAYLTNWALNYLNYTTRIVFKSCRVIPVMAFRTVVVGQRYTASQYGAGIVLVMGITLFTMGDAEGMPNFHPMGVGLITVALIADAMTANLEERQFFRIKTPATHAEVMTYLSAFAAVESFIVILVSGELQTALVHSMKHRETIPTICAFSVLGYVTVSLILLVIKFFGATNAEIVKSMRKVCQVILSFVVFPKPLSWKYFLGGALVAGSLYFMQRMGKRPIGESGPGSKQKAGVGLASIGEDRRGKDRERERDGGGAGES